jgi:predicted nucleotidyltransferase component of viral defense system
VSPKARFRWRRLTRNSKRYVEKDWYAVRLAALVAGVAEEEAYPVFSGGTSLSKAYGLIQRFSEDLDFKFGMPPGGLTRGQRRTFRNRIVAAVRSDAAFTLLDANIHPGDESRFVPTSPTGMLPPHRPIFGPICSLR